MSEFLATMIFGVGYPVLAVLVWSICAFGIAATSSERHAKALKRAQAEWGGTGRYVAEFTGKYESAATAGLIWLSLMAGAVWPVAIPVWLAWRKGTFISDALDKRDALLAADGAS